MNDDHTLPRLRPIDIVPVRRPDGEMALALHDPLQLLPRTLIVSPIAYLVLMHLDGSHTVAQVREAFRRRAGLDVSVAEIHRVVSALDEALLLAGPRADAALSQRRAAYAAAPTRDSRSRHASREALEAEIEAMLRRGAAAPVREIHGLIAPHLDYARGAPCYADAYATLAAAGPADRFVILGTNHFGLSQSAVATRKDFETTLGLVATDRAFLDRLEARLGKSLCVEEADHLNEHSIELQVLVLKVIMGDRRFSIVPVLCPAVSEATGTCPADDNGPDLRDVADAIGELVSTDGQRTTIIAAADLSHVGQRFGDEGPTTPAFLEEVGRSDRSLLTLLEERREEEFVDRLRISQNKTRICSSGCIYALLRALPGYPCRVLSYHQAVDMDTETHVTCAAAVVGR